MLFLRNLRVRLQERRNRLYKTSYRTYDTELRYLMHFLNEVPSIRSMLVALDASPSVDFKQWKSEIENTREVQFPESEEGRAKACYGILKESVSNGGRELALEWGWCFSSARHFDDIIRDFNEAVVDPFINFLHDQIDDAGNVLYLIQRFKQKAEWFRRKELYNLYQGDTSNGEASLDQELRASLFDGGVDYPFSQPESPSGKADIVALLGSDDPLVLEVKVFDPKKSKGKGHLRQGFHQVLRYANDYDQSIGYLVIFNCSNGQLVISAGDGSTPELPPRIAYGGKTYFVIPIDVNPEAVSASKEKPGSRQIISYDDLIEE